MLESHLNKVAGPQACNFIKKRPQHHRCFSVKFAKFLENTFFLQNTPSGYFFSHKVHNMEEISYLNVYRAIFLKYWRR